MWTKIEPTARRLRTTPAVQRKKSGQKSACLIIPESMIAGNFVDIYENGSRIGFSFGPTGQYAATNASKSGHIRRVTIPLKLAGRIPFGTTDVSLTEDRQLLVLDLSEIKAIGVAA